MQAATIPCAAGALARLFGELGEQIELGVDRAQASAFPARRGLE
jgi:hypothetical protein